MTDPDPTFTRDALKVWVGITRADDDAELDVIVTAVTSWIESLADVPRTADLLWAQQTHLAALMMGSRLYRRRNSPNGVEAFTGDGVTYVARYDPDIARLLRLDGFTKPKVG
jgi:hypothetical protein